jgi:hypothetical protein
MNIVLRYLIIISCLSLYTSCCSLRGTSVKNYYFKTVLAEQFITNQPDSIVFIDQQNILHSFNRVEYLRAIDTRNECRHCCEDNEIEKSYLFYNSNMFEPNIDISLVADKKADYFKITYNLNAQVSDSSLYYNGRFDYIANKIQADSIYLKLHPKIVFNDSMKVLNRFFRDVYIFEEVVQTNKIYPQKIYYSSEKGIVGIIFNNNDTWELFK